MNLLINLTIGSLLSIIDLCLISHYLNNNLNLKSAIQFKCSIKMLMNLLSFFILELANCLSINYILKLILIFISIFLVGINNQSNYRKNLKISILYVFVNLLIHIIISYLFSWIFNTTFSTIGENYLMSYTLLVICIEKYIIFILISIHNNKLINKLYMPF